MRTSKKIAMLLMAGILFVSSGASNWQVQASEKKTTSVESNRKVKKGHLKASDIEVKKDYSHLKVTEKHEIDAMVKMAKKDGKRAGKMLNEIADNDIKDIGIKEVLDEYFSAEELEMEEVNEFSEALDENIEQQIVEYTEAREERENQEKCDYVVGEQLVVFNADTTEEEIEKIVSHVSDSYEIIIDNDYKVDESLSERQKNRLKVHIPLERNSQSAIAERLSAPNGKLLLIKPDYAYSFRSIQGGTPCE